jgi:hypothetical protein
MPRRVWLRIVFGGGRMTFGALFAILGGLFVVVSVAFFDPDGLFDLHADGRVLHVVRSSATHEDRPLHETVYEFMDHRRTIRRGTSYTVDEIVRGSQVIIEFAADDPAISRVLGGHRSWFIPSPAVAGGGLLFLTLGLAIAGSGIGRRRRAVQLLRRGRTGTARLIERRNTRFVVQGRPVQDVVFEYADQLERRYQFTQRMLDTSAVDDDVDEPILFDPDRPGSACTLDDLPGKPSITAAGQIAADPSLAYAVLFLPALAVLISLACLAIPLVRFT